MSWRRAKRAEESAHDLQFYLDTETEDNLARGMSREEARAAARRKLGNPSLIREEIYRMNTAVFFEVLWQDVVYALRAMRKNRAFAVTAVLTLALGIGGNAAIFSVIRAVLLKPLEYRDPDRLVYFSVESSRREAPENSFSLGRLDEIRSAAKSFAGLGAFLSSTENLTLSGVGDPEALKAARVSSNFLDILGVQPLLGRGFLPEEEKHGGAPVAMISSSLWNRRFDADPQVAGKTLTLDSTPHTIIGVLPPGFQFPYAVDVWVTRPSEWSILPPRFWGITTLLGFARLKPGVSLDQARAEMDVLNQQYIHAHPANVLEKNRKMRVVWLKDRLVSNVRSMLWMLFGAVGFVLLIACANVASLLLARGTFRAREFAVRSALGAARGRLIRQLLAESLVLALAGGAIGVLFAKWGLSAIARLSAFAPTTAYNPLSLPGAGAIHLDGMVIGFTLALSIATGVIFGLFPSLQVSRPSLAGLLRDQGRAASHLRRPGARSFLVVGQIALSIVLLIGAGLLIQSFARLRGVDPGFHPANLLTMKIALPPSRYDTDQKKAAFFDQVTQRIEAIPGVRSAAMAMSLPTTTWIRTNIGRVEGLPDRPLDEQRSFAVIQSVTPGYFRTMGIPLRRGREFTARDNVTGAPSVIMINESLARRFWPDFPRGVDPVGKHMEEAYDQQFGMMEIVGVAADIHEGGLAMDAVPEFYVPCREHPPQTAYVAVRANGDPLRLVNSIRSQVLTIDRDQSITEVKTMDEVFDAALGPRRLTMLLLGIFAAVALLLAVVGIYGVIAYSVAQRTQEVGIRRALGAQQRDILRLVLGQGLVLALAGVAIGIGGALALTRLMNGLLFHVTATDPATFGGIGLLFIFVALVASFIPAQRAARIDPMESLRV